ncbi:MAG: four helix bundle protein [Bacteroidales bacterium]|nr:four helix bundle protein [Deltaproteobacteria bacterium]MBL7137647.1 four helix bundle protein [Bacteroidales bacterium]
MGTAIKSFRDLSVYQLAFSTAMEIFHLTKEFPMEEKYSLTDQIRRASRSICSNIAEGWYKRRYPAAFICKLTDSISEAAETQTWLEFSLNCNYIDKNKYVELFEKYEHIIAQLLTMEKKSDSFCYK